MPVIMLYNNFKVHAYNLAQKLRLGK